MTDVSRLAPGVWRLIRNHLPPDLAALHVPGSRIGLTYPVVRVHVDISIAGPHCLDQLVEGDRGSPTVAPLLPVMSTPAPVVAQAGVSFVPHRFRRTGPFSPTW